jgi:D-serine deaminase-like pyridoxal phosphate-dependent protein
VLPNHSCLAAACHRRYHLLRGDRVIERLEPAWGW